MNPKKNAPVPGEHGGGVRRLPNAVVVTTVLPANPQGKRRVLATVLLCPSPDASRALEADRIWEAVAAHVERWHAEMLERYAERAA